VGVEAEKYMTFMNFFAQVADFSRPFQNTALMSAITGSGGHWVCQHVLSSVQDDALFEDCEDPALSKQLFVQLCVSSMEVNMNSEFCSGESLAPLIEFLSEHKKSDDSEII